MKPETERYLDKARQSLNGARAVAGIELAEAAGRAAYLAMFHAGACSTPINPLTYNTL